MESVDNKIESLICPFVPFQQTEVPFIAEFPWKIDENIPILLPYA